MLDPIRGLRISHFCKMENEEEKEGGYSGRCYLKVFGARTTQSNIPFPLNGKMGEMGGKRVKRGGKGVENGRERGGKWEGKG